MERFEKPVFVACGRTMIREITTPADALDYLAEWPRADRDAIHAMVVRTCHRAHDGLVPVSIAEKAFARWAQQNGVLEDLTVPPWIAAQRAGRGGVPI